MFVIASHFESLSIVVLEALSVKTPVLVTEKCEVLKGHVLRSKAGFCYNTYNEFEEAINKTYQDNTEYLNMGECGRKYVEDNYSWDKIIDSMRKIIDNVDFCKKDTFYTKEEIVDEVIINRKPLPAFRKIMLQLFWRQIIIMYQFYQWHFSQLLKMLMNLTIMIF